MSQMTYERKDQILPRENLIGVSRTRSINQFTTGNSKARKLSILPPLKKQSIGKNA